jgi:hypothetical protein
VSWLSWRWFDPLRATTVGQWLALVQPLLVAVVRTAWLAPWLAWLQALMVGGNIVPLLPWWMVLLAPLAGYGVARLAQGQSLVVGRLLVGGAGIGVALGWAWLAAPGPWDPVQLFAPTNTNLPPVLFAVVGVALLWLRGVQESELNWNRQRIGRTFGLALAAWALLLLVDPSLAAAWAGWLWLLLLAGLIGLALASLEQARRDGEQMGPALPLHKAWLGSVLGVIGLLLVLGLLVAVWLTPDAVIALLQPLLWVLRIVGLAISYLFLGLSYLLFLALMPLFEWLRARMQANGREPPEQGTAMQEMLEAVEAGEGIALPPELATLLPWLGALALLLIVGLAAAFALRRNRPRPEPVSMEARESIFSMALLRDQLASLWKQRRKAAEGPFLSLAGEVGDRQAVRKLYQEFLAAQQAAGQARSPGETAVEYQRRLAGQLPAVTSALVTLTTIYGQARYSNETLAHSALVSAEQAWELIRQELEQREKSNGE